MSAVRNTDSYRLLEQKESGGLFFVYEKGVAGLSDERHMIYMKKLDFTHLISKGTQDRV